MIVIIESGVNLSITLLKEIEKIIRIVKLRFIM